MTSPDRVILFVIDGLRPDALTQANVPVISHLISHGAYAAQAQAVLPSISLPCHVSMFYAVPPSRHGVLSNTWTPPQPPVRSLIDLVREQGQGTAAFYTWEPLRDLSAPGSLDLSYYRRLGDPGGDSDLEMGSAAAAYLSEQRPNLAFVYLGAVDEVGHRDGWMSHAYLNALEKADRAIGLVRESLQANGLLSGAAFFVLADHGGHGYDHSEGTAEDLTIPWIACGPGIRQGQVISSPVSLVDTAPTIAHLLGLPLPAEWSGRVVVEALQP
jgi:predicted AlkP superfamily pyrophosphatase or phosphodiesterase